MTANKDVYIYVIKAPGQAGDNSDNSMDYRVIQGGINNSQRI